MYIFLLLCFLSWCCGGSGKVISVLSPGPNVLSYAIANSIAGDVIQIYPGRYTECDLQIGISIAIVAISDGVIIDCSGSSSSSKRIMSIVGVGGVRLVGMQFKGGGGNTIAANNGMPKPAMRKYRPLPILRQKIPTRQRVLNIQLFVSSKGRLLVKGDAGVQRPRRRKTGTGSNSSSMSFSGGGCLLVANSSVVLDGMTLSQGQVVASNAGVAVGGGLAAMDSSVTISNSSIVNNGIVATATGQGGGAWFSRCAVSIVNTTISNNYINLGTLMQGGGACFISCSSIVITGPNTAISSNRISSANATSDFLANGGGIFVGSSTFVSISNAVTVENNAISANVWFSWVSIYGAGVSIADSTRVVITGFNSLSRNGIVASSYQDAGSLIFGGGLHINNCTDVIVGANMYISSNSISFNATSSNGDGQQYGAGLYVGNCISVSLLGPGFVVAGNRLGTQTVLNGKNDQYPQGAGLYAEQSGSIRMVGPLSFVNNSIVYSGGAGSRDGFAYGAGVHLEFVTDVYWGGPLEVSSNAIVCTVVQARYLFMNGGGIFLWNLQNMASVGAVLVSNNAMVHTSTSSAASSPKGAGFYAQVCPKILMVGPDVVIENNSIQSNVKKIATPPYIPPASSVSSNAIGCDAVTISETSGSLDNGNSPRYLSNTRCSWLLSPSDTFQVFDVFNLTFTLFETENGYDFLYLYDGPSSFFPLIGKYSGSFGDLNCLFGPCPSLSSSVLTSYGQLFLVFTSDGTTNFGGFRFSWNMIEVNRYQGSMGVLLADPNNYPSFSLGAGLVLSSSSLQLSNAVFRSNRVVNPFFAAGAALYVESVRSKVKLSNCSFANNVASATVAGGAVAVFSFSKMTCWNCSMQANVAIATGSSCFYASMARGMLCGSVFGSGLLSASGASVVLVATVLSDNTLSCNTGGPMQCSVFGGSMAVLHSFTTVTMSSISCSTSSLLCPTCTWAAGGCIYIDSASVGIQNGSISSNLVIGIGSGGGLHAAGAAVVSLSNCTVAANSAAQGGGASMVDSALVLVRDTYFGWNIGTSIGGGMSVRDDASISLSNTTFHRNNATRASVLLSYNDNNVAKYAAKGSTILTTPGSAALMLGRLNFSSSNVWQCTQPGTVFTQDATGEFFSLACVPCGEGTFAADMASTLTLDRTCQKCPYGATCIGSSEFGNGLMALGGFWGTINDSGNASFYPCPSYYCCPPLSTCSYNHCQSNRVGTLCGQCAPGYGLRYFTEGCGSDEDNCGDAAWFGVVVVIASLIFVLFFLKTTGRPASGMLSVLLYFYQVLPLIKSTSWKYTSPSVIIFIQSVFDLAPSSGESNSNGVCIAKSMTASQKLGGRIMVHAVLIGTLFFTFLVHTVIRQFKLPIPWVKDQPANASQYLATAVRLLTIAYITLILVPLQMLQCVQVEGHSVWWYDASIGCYASWQIGGFVALAVLLPMPMVLIVVMLKKWRSEKDLEREWHRSIWRVVTNGYRVERRWWLGVSLYRRFLLALAFTAISDANWRAMTIVVLCLGFLALNIKLKPFQTRMTRWAEMSSLLILGCLAALTYMQLSRIQFGTSAPIANEPALEWIQFWLALVPIITYVLFIGYQVLMMGLRRRVASSPLPTTSPVRPILISSSNTAQTIFVNNQKKNNNINNNPNTTTTTATNSNSPHFKMILPSSSLVFNSHNIPVVIPQRINNNI